MPFVGILSGYCSEIQIENMDSILLKKNARIDYYYYYFIFLSMCAIID